MDPGKKSKASRQGHSVPRFAIGDVHGRPFWKLYINKEFTEFYFTGDYFDSFDVPFAKQYENFLEICNAARNDKRIKMCLGNHDYHYLSGVRNQFYSGYQDRNCKKIGAVLEENIGLMQIVYVTEDEYLISHAGVTSTFLRSIKGKKPEDINSAFIKDRNILNFNGWDMYGNDITQSPIWVRPESLEYDHLKGYNQIVGHTPVRKIAEFSMKDGNKIVLIDTHDTESIFAF
jgi:hypothetical protein